MSLIGGAGMFATSIWQPVIGSWLDNAKTAALNAGSSLEQAELIAGQQTLSNIAIFPMVLVVLFGILFTQRKKLEANRV